jgi:tetrathionate reductase subunit B
MDRRKFLKAGAMISAGTCAYGLPLLTGFKAISANENNLAIGHRWGMVVDLRKCLPGCTACVDACRKENNVAYFNDSRWDIHWIHKVTIRSKHTNNPSEKDLPLLCNQCDEPPCALVCPVQATYKRADGIVIVDHHRCIGCRYCVVACPYNERFFNYKENPDWPNPDFPKRSHGVAESCNFCAHRVDVDKKPACVDACDQRALVFGDLNDPQSEVSTLIHDNSVKRLREGLGTAPKVYYIGL